MRHLLTTFAATGLIQLGNLASGILAARLLLPDGRGELAAILLWPALIAALGGFSINTAAAYFAAREEGRTPQIFAAATWLTLALSLVLIAVGLAIIPFAYASYSSPTLRLAILCLAFTPLGLFGLCCLAILQGRLKMGLFNALRVLLPVAYLAGLLVALAIGEANVAGFVIAFLCANALVALCALSALVRFGWVGLRAPKALVRAVAGYAASSHVGFAVSVLAQRLDQALIALLLPSAELGLYAVALAAGSAAALVGGTMELVAFPKVSGARDNAARASVIGRYARATTALAALAAVILIPILPWLIELFFGRAFAQAVEPARILALAAIPLGLKTALYAGLRGIGQPLAVGRIETVVLLTLAASLAVLLPWLGIAGAAWSVLVAQAIGGALAAARVRAALGLSWAALAVPTDDEMRRLGHLLRRAWS